MGMEKEGMSEGGKGERGLLGEEERVRGRRKVRVVRGSEEGEMGEGGRGRREGGGTTTTTTRTLASFPLTHVIGS